jgi:hypothetical protein
MGQQRRKMRRMIYGSLFPSSNTHHLFFNDKNSSEFINVMLYVLVYQDMVCIKRMLPLIKEMERFVQQ